jgi:hypothetical protein
MSKGERKLWIQIHMKVPTYASHARVLRTLRRSIERGDYKIPSTWRVYISWKNKEDAEWKRGPWTREMRQSANSSDGWDYAVLKYLRSQWGR